MDSTRPPSPRLARCRSGTPRLCQLEPMLSPNLTARSLPRSNSAAKSRPLSSPDAAARQHGYRHRRQCKENRKSPEPAWGSTAVKLSPTAPWMSPSAWALSPGRYPSEEAKGGGGRGMMSGMFGFLRKKKEPSAREEMGHQLRMLAVSLLQWRFVNARTGAGTATANFVVEKKLFFAFLKITELRNIVAAKRILISRRKYKLKVIKLLNPQLNLLNRWELLARRHLDAVASLSGVLETRCLKLPLAEGAQANLEMLQQFICEAVEIMSQIEAAIRIFFSKAELVNSLLSELLQVMQEEVKSLDELWKTSSLTTSLKTHEISLRANLIQGTKEEATFSPHRTYEINTGESWRNFRSGFLI
ncbi:hypothetical protein HPP92_020665 [Vanilla planifolia]|uniref:QWRF motif-containing protein 3 n=2 Tax=Vanilla planifolia TaxID=51239 RepID=A0A835UGG7_VANPL|nr:hypothetical protein HPP92_020665 [Vanilla planifolia]